MTHDRHDSEKHLSSICGESVSSKKGSAENNYVSV